MNQEFNQIIMKTGKTKLFEGLLYGRTAIMFIGKNPPIRTVPEGVEILHFASYVDFKDYCIYLHDLNDEALHNYDCIIVYSNEPRSKNLKYIESLSRLYDLDKWVFMFSSEM